MSDRVSVEGSDARPLRDGSDARPLRDASDARPIRRPSMNDLHIPPVIGAPHRRMSRIDGGLGLGLPRYGYRRPSVASSFRTDHSSQLHHPHKVANTYRLAPKDDERFSSSRVQKVINVVLRSFLDGEVYDAKHSRQMSQNIADVVRTRVKEMRFPRYKIVTNVVITPASGQTIQFDSRCLWDVETDSFASATYQSSSLHAVATVHAIYFE